MQLKANKVEDRTAIVNEFKMLLNLFLYNSLSHNSQRPARMVTAGLEQFSRASSPPS